MKAHPYLETFLNPYDPGVQHIALALRQLILEWIPEANELIWDGYNAVSMAYSKSEKLQDAFCHIAVYQAHVNLGFNRGAELSKGTIPVEGTGKFIRHIKVRDMDVFPEAAVHKMIFEALQVSENRNPALRMKTSAGTTRVVSVSDKKIRPKNQ